MGLILLLFVIIIAPFVLRQAAPSYTPVADQQILDSLVAQLEQAQPATPQKPPSLKLVSFNPNSLSLDEWRQLGVPPSVARRIINYRSKAGDYRYKIDLKKIYGLTDSLFQRLYPYIDLPAERPPRKSAFPRKESYARREPEASRPFHRKSYRITPFDLNQADTLQLEQIRGIGTRLSARIVLFRDRLGGFHQINQVNEVYGLPPEVVDSLRKYAFVQPDFVPNLILLNTVTYEELRAHPYISNQVARVIIAYREQHGPFQQVEDLRKIKLIDEELFQKVQPYLSL